MKPLIPEPVGDVELEDHERLEDLLDAAHASFTRHGHILHQSGQTDLLFAFF